MLTASDTPSRLTRSRCAAVTQLEDRGVEKGAVACVEIFRFGKIQLVWNV
jgi:hypothetical protein